MTVANIISKKDLGLNRQTYQRLKLALSLGLRRQIFVGICDDLRLRNRLAGRLHSELRVWPQSGDNPELNRQIHSPYPRLVSLNLNLLDPNPLGQIDEWYTQNPQGRSLSEGLHFPTFQILGVERLTRKPPATQWAFLKALQQMPQNGAAWECSLLLWLPRPWVYTIEQSAPEFWHYHTGIFKFEGEPTPVPAKRNQGGTKTTAPKLVAITPLSRPTSPPMGTAIALDSSETVTQTVEIPAAEAPLTPQETEVSFAEPELPSETEELIPTVVPVAETRVQPTVSDRLNEIHQHIEQLQQQKAPAAALSAAYLSLGNYYRDRVERGDSSLTTLNLAIEGYAQAMEWLETSEAAADGRAMLEAFGISADKQADTLNDLGNLYWMRSRSLTVTDEKLRDLESSIHAYQVALQYTQPLTRAHAWAMIHNNLGAVYSDLARYRDPATHLDKSVQAYNEALFHRRAALEAGNAGAQRAYAATQNNLGTAYWNLAQHTQPVQHLKSAIAAYNEALRYYTPETQPLDYAMIQNNLGTTYWNLAQYQDAEESLMLAISAYRVALMYRTPETAPTAAAATQNNLGTAYWHLANQPKTPPAARAEFLAQAIAAYEAAIATVEMIQAHHTQKIPLAFDLFATHNNLGLAHYQLVNESRLSMDEKARSQHLESALEHQVKALQGWQPETSFYQTAFGFLLQTIRAFYSELGMRGQNLALSKVPGHLLSDIMRNL